MADKKLDASLTKRLARVEGQIKGVRTMMEEGRNCEDVLMQLSAINSALHNISGLVLLEHIGHCVSGGIQSGNEDDTVDNLQHAVEIFLNMK